MKTDPSRSEKSPECRSVGTSMGQKATKQKPKKHSQNNFENRCPKMRPRRRPLTPFFCFTPIGAGWRGVGAGLARGWRGVGAGKKMTNASVGGIKGGEQTIMFGISHAHGPETRRFFLYCGTVFCKQLLFFDRFRLSRCESRIPREKCDLFLV